MAKKLFTLALASYSTESHDHRFSTHPYSFVTKGLAEAIGEKLYNSSACDSYRILPDERPYNAPWAAGSYADSSDDMPF